MILITKDESIIVRKAFPNVPIIRTCIQKSKRHKYYLPESFEYLRLIVKTNRDAADILSGKKK